MRYFKESFFLFLLMPVICCGVYSFSIIDTPGFYKLAANVSNQITISASNVTLDMKGYTISSGANGIIINSNLNNVTIKNGTISSVTSDGIQVNSGCKDITLDGLTVKNASRGVFFDTVSNGCILNCDMNLNTTGLELDTCQNIAVKNCSALANVQAGYCLLSSSTCALFACKAIGTGDGNANSSGDESFVFGFVSANGHGNVFEKCVADGTQNLNATNQDTVIAGFGLKEGEECSRILGCEASNTTVSPGGLAIPYGVWLEGTFDSLVTLTEYGISGITGDFIDWSPDGKYVVGTVDSAGTADLGVYEYDRNFNRLNLLAVDTIGNRTFHGDWSPDGKYIAIAISSGVNPDLRVYKFDRIINEIILVDSFHHPGSGIGCSWSLDGLYVAYSGTVSGGVSQLIFKFDRLTETMTQVATDNGTEAESIEWSPVERDVFAIGDDNGQVVVKSFDRSDNSITTIDTLALATGQINKIAWSPDGKYIAVASDSTGDDIEVVEYANQTLSKVAGQSVGSGQGVSWSPDSKYLASAYQNSITVYRFDRENQLLNEMSTDNFGDTVREVEWSPDGEAIALTGDSDQVTPVMIEIYTGLNFPQKNVICENRIYCNVGNSYPSGIGIFGSSISNSIIENVAFDNTFNYQAVTNVFNQLFGLGPSTTQNISSYSTDPICKPIDIPAKMGRIELLLESLIDNLL